MQYISKTYRINIDKKTSLTYGGPDIYLVAQIRRYWDPDYYVDYFCYAIYGDHYVEKIAANVQKKLVHHEKGINSEKQLPIIYGYGPTINMSPELDNDNTCYFQELIGVLHWDIYPGRDYVAV